MDALARATLPVRARPSRGKPAQPTLIARAGCPVSMDSAARAPAREHARPAQRHTASAQTPRLRELAKSAVVRLPAMPLATVQAPIACRASTSTPCGTTTCLTSKQLQLAGTCNSQGTCSQSTQTCAACVQNACADCTPSTSQCSGGVPQTCDSSGHWASGTCGTGKVCSGTATNCVCSSGTDCNGTCTDTTFERLQLRCLREQLHADRKEVLRGVLCLCKF